MSISISNFPILQKNKPLKRSMYRFLLPKTLISSRRLLSTIPEATPGIDLSLAEANLVEKIEDAIHRNIVKKSKPDWLVFVPGASYWVPPRRTSYGVAQLVNTLTNPISEEESLAAITLQVYPSSDYFFNNDVELFTVMEADGDLQLDETEADLDETEDLPVDEEDNEITSI